MRYTLDQFCALGFATRPLHCTLLAAMFGKFAVLYLVYVVLCLLFVYSVVYSVMYFLVYSLVYSLMYSLMYYLVYSLVYIMGVTGHCTLHFLQPALASLGIFFY